MRIDISAFLYDLFHDRDRQIPKNPQPGKVRIAPLAQGGDAWLSFSSVGNISQVDVWPNRLSAIKGAGRSGIVPIMRIRTEKKPVVTDGVITSIGVAKVEFFESGAGDQSFEFGTALGEQVGKMIMQAGQLARHTPDTSLVHSLPPFVELRSVSPEPAVLQAAA